VRCRRIVRVLPRDRRSRARQDLHPSRGAPPTLADGLLTHLLPQCDAWQTTSTARSARPLGLSPSATAAGVSTRSARSVQDLGRSVCILSSSSTRPTSSTPRRLDHPPYPAQLRVGRLSALVACPPGLPAVDRLAPREKLLLLSPDSPPLRHRAAHPRRYGGLPAHRLRLAGDGRELFSDEAVTLVHDHAGGSPGH
jgi:hypothetical protein